MIEEYEEEILMQEEVPEPPLTDMIYIETTCINSLPMSPTIIGRVAAMLRLSIA